ncbi:uncharacterized protein DFL_005556 [Arthrobotrys flagrans]|uniref:Uncharacterized protein n=1 Tax=Arthrobotrys flagrans TaxID=97331 RepID=A0A436ZXT7_ARTFL|nr:hypothetical protein DFL_005556 [Arthrobotrys flagrans]
MASTPGVREPLIYGSSTGFSFEDLKKEDTSSHSASSSVDGHRGSDEETELEARPPKPDIADQAPKSVKKKHVGGSQLQSSEKCTLKPSISNKVSKKFQTEKQQVEGKQAAGQSAVTKQNAISDSKPASSVVAGS